MSEENQIQDEVNENESNETQEQETVQEETPEQEQVDDPMEQAINERLAKMKANMDRMAKERDEALKKAAEMEQAKKQDQIKRLEEEGKLQEALEMKLAEAEAKLKVYEEENTKLNRDNVLNGSLTGLEFRNDRSRQMAYRDIVDQLVQNEDGLWVHKSGTSIQEFVDSYSKSEENSFLFRTKSNSGAGNGAPNGTPAMEAKKSIGEMSTNEILALAAKGQLGNFNY